MINDITTSLAKGAAGMLGTLIAIVTPVQEQIAWIAGMCITAASLFSISLDIRRKLREDRERRAKQALNSD